MPQPDAATTDPGGPELGSFSRPPLRTRIGPYRLVRVLGEGGMGVVYLAEQDEPVHREVAVKVLRAGAESADVVARFEGERQTLAVMEHPHITRVYDAGTTRDGLPYFVMERVDGEPITDYADEHRLTVRERVQLFTQVCQAIQHAHQKGIIHRDLKPSNVLVADVDGVPQAKVIDFGIAKALQPTPGRGHLTSTGLVVGTPAYMSPEQFVSGGAGVDTRSDVYALGLLLYELLVGVLPLDEAADRSARMWGGHREVPGPGARVAALDAATSRRVAEARRTDAAALRRALTGELAWVLLHALEPDPGRRYQTAHDLARDLDRFLHYQPVLATGGSAMYRARKFVRRHRTAVAFSGGIAVLLVGFSVAMAVVAGRLAHARTVAQARQAQAETLIGYMLGDLRQRLTGTVPLAVLDTVGAKAMQYFAAVPDAELSDAERSREALMLDQMGNLRLDQGRPAEAAVLAGRSLAIAERLVARDPTNTGWQIGLGHAHFAVGRAFWERGNVDSALAHFEPFLRISDALIRRYPDSASFRTERAYALTNIGNAREGRGDLRGAIAAYGAAYDITRRQAERDRGNADAQRDVGLVLHGLGRAQNANGDLRGALASHREERARMAALVAHDTANTESRRYLAMASVFVGAVRLDMGAMDSASADLHRGRDLYAGLVARDTTNVEWRFGRANATRRVAQLLLERGDALGALQELDAHAAELASFDPAAAARVARERAAALPLRARALVATGRASAATAALAPAVAAAESAHAGNPRAADRRDRLAELLLTVGEARNASRDSAGAHAAWRRVVALAGDTDPRATPTAALAVRASALLALGRARDARPLTRILLDRGFARPSFVALLRVPNPTSAPEPHAP